MSEIATSPAARTGLWKWTLLISLLSAGLIFILFKAFGTDPHEVPFKLGGQPAPAFSLRRMDNGQTLSLADLKGRPVIINFWATWCGPCRQEHPVIEWGHKQFGDKVQFLGVVFEDSVENAKAYLSERPPSFPQLVDPNSSMAVDYGVAGVPETYFIDRNGTILGKYIAPIDPQTLAERVKILLASGTPQAEARP